jgi:hypothetical protein
VCSAAAGGLDHEALTTENEDALAIADDRLAVRKMVVANVAVSTNVVAYETISVCSFFARVQLAYRSRCIHAASS